MGLVMKKYHIRLFFNRAAVRRLTLYFDFFYQQFWRPQADKKTSVNMSQGSAFLVWIFPPLIDSSKTKISNVSSSQIQLFSNVSSSTFFTHRQTDRQTDRQTAFFSHDYSWRFFFSWREKKKNLKAWVLLVSQL